MEDEDWLSAHLCLDTLLTFSSASADTAAQALACPLIETLCRLLRRLLRHLRRCGAAAAAAAAAATAAVQTSEVDSSTQLAAAQVADAAADMAVVTRALPPVRTPERTPAAPPCEGDQGEFPSATTAVLSECMQPPAPPDSSAAQRTLREVPGSRLPTDAETPPALRTPVIGGTPTLADTTSFGSNATGGKLPQGLQHALLQQQSLDSMGSAGFTSQKIQEHSLFLLQLRVGEEPDLQLLQVGPRAFVGSLSWDDVIRIHMHACKDTC